MADQEFPEGHDVVVSKEECPKCGSSKGFVTYADGHAHCFGAGCDHYVPAEGGKATAPRQPRVPDTLLDPATKPGAFDPLTRRGITSETMRKYGVFQHGYNGQPVQVYPYFTMEGEVAGQKLRFPSKDFTFLKADGAPGVAQCQLFGRQVYGDRFDRQVIITEGELDALSIAQTQSFKTAVVSVNTGSQSAAKCLKANYLWLDRFKEIILWFDNDEAGKLATEECAKLFKVGKVRVATAPAGLKDASDILQANRPGDITVALYAATAWRPRGIVNAADMSDDVRAPREKARAYEYPASMPKLQEMSGGIHPGEVTFHVAGTGVGKSTQLREIVYDLAVRQGVKIGSMWFEDTRRDSQLLLMSLHANRRLQLDPVPDPESPTFEAEAAAYDKKMLALHNAVFGSRLFELFDAETAEWTFEAVEGYVYYMVRALDCEAVAIDPMSYIQALMDAGMDERRALDMIGARMAKLAKELGIPIMISHHLKRTMGTPHEEGAPTSLNELRGSGGLANSASFVVGWERNNQAEGDGWRVVQSRVLKPHRMVGRSGLADVLYYEETGRLIPSPIPFPPVGKPDGKDEERGGTKGFSPVSPSGDY